jgi:hypothetical protein
MPTPLLIVVALASGAVLVLDHYRFRARKQALLAIPGFLTAEERQLFAGAALDQASHVVAAAHRRRLEEFATWLEAHHDLHGYSWLMSRPDAPDKLVEIRELDDFARYIPLRRHSWAWQENPERRVSWRWDLDQPRVTASSRRRLQWSFEPVSPLPGVAGGQ